MSEQFQKDLEDTILRTKDFIKNQIEGKQKFLNDFTQKNNKEPNEEQMMRINAKFATDLAEKVLEFLPQSKYIDPNSMPIKELETLVFETQDKFFNLGQTKSFMLLYKDALDKVLKNPDIDFDKHIKNLFKLSANDEFADLVSNIIISKNAPLDRILNDILVEKTYFLYKHLFSHFKIEHFDELVMKAIINDDKFFYTSIDSESFDFQFLELFVKSAVESGTEKHLKSIDQRYEFEYSQNDNEVLNIAIERQHEDIINYIIHKDSVMDLLSVFSIQQLQINPEIRNHLISKKNFSQF